jgi:hypothetical protein
MSGPLPLDFSFEVDELDSDLDHETGMDGLTGGNTGSSGHISNLLSNKASSSTTPLPPTTSLFSVMPNAVPTRLLSIYLPISDALDALHAAKPNHHFPDLAEAFQSAGYEYIDEVVGMTAQHLAEEVDGLTLPAARQLQAFAKAQMQYQAAFD